MPGPAGSAPVYLAAAVRELDRLAIEEYGIPGFELMQRAGRAAFEALRTTWPDAPGLACFCGSGNNGGDGYVIAALARKAGLHAEVIAVGNPENLQGDARHAWQMAIAAGVPVLPFGDRPETGVTALQAGTVIVDALLGTGLTGVVRGDYARAIALINASGHPVLAVDIPSGLCSDTGAILGDAIQADLTVTFIGRKRGQVTGQGPAVCGRLVFDDLGVPPALYERVSPAPG